MSLPAKHKNRMFPFITHTWNPLGGECPHNCKGCWAKAYINRIKMVKYQGPYKIDEKQINRKFKPGSFVFVCDMLDLFAANVPMEAISLIMRKIETQPDVTFLLLTKNPRYMWVMELPKNVVAGATIESEFDPRLYGFDYSKAPLMNDRIKAMIDINDSRKFVSIEPIMDFSPGAFLSAIRNIKPEFVAVGFDNYNSGLPEPESLQKVLDFITEIEKLGIKVYRKTIREPILTVGGK
jgi:protein gp37